MITASSRRSSLQIVGSPSAPPPLVERVVELELLEAAVGRVTAGCGKAVVVEAAAGLGKTALLERAAELAAAAGCHVRRANPVPLERHFPFAVVRALLEAPVRDTPPAERARLLDGAAAPAGRLLLEGRVPEGDTTMLVAHSVLWLCSALAERQPLVLVVDDAQCADRSSLEALAYLARRAEDVPLLLLVAARTGDPDAETDLLTMLGSARSASVLRPRPLTSRGALELIRAYAPAAPAGVCVQARRSVAGNPWLLRQLGQQIAADGTLEEPPASARVGVRHRLAALTPRDRRAAEALAVVGAETLPQVVAAASGLEPGELGLALDALAAAGLLAEDGMRFAHGLVAAAIVADIPCTERERLHSEAAHALMAVHADPRLIAGHLLACGPQGDPAVSAALQEAARQAPARAAARYLERALAERAPGDDRGQLLAWLGQVSYDAGLPGAREHLREALEAGLDRERRIAVLTRLAALHLVDAADDGLAQAFEQELANETDAEVRLAVEAASLDALLLARDRHHERAYRVAAIDLSGRVDPLLERVIYAHRAWVGVERGLPDAHHWARLARRALEDELLLAEAHWRAAYALCARVLTVCDEPGAEGAIRSMREAALERGSLRLRTAAEWYAADRALRTGRVAEAENLARLALDLVDGGPNVFTGAVEVLVCALAERGAFEEAREVLRNLDGEPSPATWDIGVRHARARLCLAEGDFERALGEALQLGELCVAQGRPNPSLTPWRSTASLALAHLGRRAEAARLADQELALAERFGAPVPIAGALHARAVAEPDPGERIALCERALTRLGKRPAGLEVIRLRLELGAARAALGRRLEARLTLRPAFADADAAGAQLLATRARRELVATGLRPRQAALEGVAALTPRQRQICELAAAGKSNREIAQELFLSAKTVETHLVASYRKLGVNAREALANALSG